MSRLIPVYKPDGSRIGGFGKVDTLAEAELELRTLAVEPRHPQQRLLPGWRPPLGGVRTGCCNVFEIDEDAYIAAIDILEHAGWRRWPEHDDSVASLYRDYDDEHEPPPHWTQYATQSTGPKDNSENYTTLVGKTLRYIYEGQETGDDYCSDRATLVLDRDSGRIVDHWIG